MISLATITRQTLDITLDAMRRCATAVTIPNPKPFNMSHRPTSATIHRHHDPITPWLVLIAIGLSLFIAATTSAQQSPWPPTDYNVGRPGDPFLSAPALELTPRYANERVVPASFQTQGDPPLAVPSPDPEPPRWGRIENPDVNVQVPVRQYLLAGPARGIFQHQSGQEYERPVIDPYGVMMADTQSNVAIDLYRPDGIAPAGVFGDHTLKGGGTVLVSYRMQTQEYHDVLVGTRRVGNDAILSSFAYSPTRASIQKHIIQMEYAPTDDLTLMAYLPFYQNSIDFVDATGSALRTSFTNPGDIPVSLMYVLKRWKRQQIHLNFGMTLPLGFLDQLGHTPSPTSPDLTYLIRTSTGSWGLMPGLTYRGQSDNWTWGLQSIEQVNLGRNRLSYQVGNIYDVTAWASRRWTNRLASSARLDARYWGNIHGADPRLNQLVSPMNRPDLQRGERLDLLFGLSYYGIDRLLPGQRLSIEAGAPLYQRLSGPQLSTNWLLNFNWSIMF